MASDVILSFADRVTMSACDLLIDGYNLLHAAGLGRVRYGPGDLQRARQALLRRLFDLLTPAEIAQTAVVFDARKPPPHLPAQWYIHGLRVLYARPHGDADLILEDLIEEHSAPRRLTVVSSDQRLQRAAQARRASAVASEKFLEFLEHRRPTATRTPPPTASAPAVPRRLEKERDYDPTSDELAYWMSVFSDVRVSELISTTELPRTLQSKPQPGPARPAPRPGSAGSTGSANSATRKARRSSAARNPGQSAPRSASADQPVARGPELFSDEWVAELQKWADEQQRKQK